MAAIVTSRAEVGLVFQPQDGVKYEQSYLINSNFSFQLKFLKMSNLWKVCNQLSKDKRIKQSTACSFTWVKFSINNKGLIRFCHIHETTK